MATGNGNLGYQVVGGAGGSTSVTIVTPPATAGTLDITGLSGSTLATWKSFTFVVFSGTIDIGGVTFNAGTYTYDNGSGTIDALSYDATASTDAKIIFQS